MCVATERDIYVDRGVTTIADRTLSAKDYKRNRGDRIRVLKLRSRWGNKFRRNTYGQLVGREEAGSGF